jgi:hypothetical protein
LPASRRRSRTLVVGLIAVALLALPSPGRACSICRCGDATFNALGRDGYAAEGFRAALDWERFDKDEGNAALDAESQVENRFTGLLSYGFNDRITLLARIPYSVRNLTPTTEGEQGAKVHTSGLSDPEIYGQLRLWSSKLAGGLGRRSSLSLNAGVKLPWGQNDVEQGGERVDEHGQPGTGSTDLFGSLAFLYLIDKESALFVSSGYRHTGENDFGYRYGSTFLANAAYEHKLGKVLDGVVELNFRHAKKDRVDSEGTLDDDTGGSLLYVTPRLLVNLGGGVVLRFAGQIPVARALNGFQTERAVANVGLTYLFSH